MRRPLELSLLGMAACCVLQPAFAQEGGQADGQVRAAPMENVRFDYAQVLRAEPVYQTLHATRTEERCDLVPAEPERPREDSGKPGLFSRMVDSVKDVFTRDEPAPPPPPPVLKRNCRLVQVGRQFQRPIAYDVDYVYKGTKYRSRLAEDPGNRLRVRVTVTPWEDLAPTTASP
ncbi:MAG: hypothetical protein J0L89_05265 [Xanthomonadales bacterium]|mgnify:CR=1 FL=1|nr:hypothetical protein [Xanthomonadales bacterium]HRF83692.1 hypothetical protein [Pseudoxanthomonas sp.]